MTRQRSLCLLTLLLATGCRPAPTPPPQAAPVVVATIEAAGQEDTPTARFSGTTKPHRQVELAFRVSGYVESVFSLRDGEGEIRPVQAGDTVTAGTVLARVQSADYQAQASAATAGVQTARANVAQAEAKQSEARAAQRQAVDLVSEARTGRQAAQAQRRQALSGVQQTEAGIVAAQSEVTLAQSSFARADDLFQSGSATQPQEDAARAALDSAKARLAAAQGARNAAQGRVAEADAQVRASQARITAAQSGVAASQSAVAEAGAALRAAQAQVAQAQAAAGAQGVPLSETVIRAPLNGIILARHIEVGSLVGPGSPAFTLADVSRLDVLFGVPETDAARLRVGQRVSLTWGAMDAVPVTGTVTELAPAADPQTRVFDVQVSVPNHAGREKIGTIATLTLGANASPSNALVAPLSAIVPSRDKPSGYAVLLVVQENGRSVARYRDVELGPTFGETVVVHGIPRGAPVVASAPSQLYDGESVRPADAGGGG